MSFGISVIRNDNDEVVIDENHGLMRVISEGTASKSNNIYTIPIPAGLSVDPIVYIGWPIGSSIFINGGFSNGNIKIHTDTGPASLTYWVCAFSPPPAPAADSYGLEIFKSNGERVFSSSSKYMRMKGIIPAYTQSGGTAGPGPFSHTSLPNLYPVAVPMARVTVVLAPGQYPPHGAWAIGGGVRQSSTSFIFNQFAIVPLASVPGLPYRIGGSEAILLGSVL